MPNQVEVRQSGAFSGWLRGLRDSRAKARIAARIQRLRSGNPGDSKSVGQGVMEVRIDYGPGYRVYYAQTGHRVVVLLCGGDKSSQDTDIIAAKAMAQALKE